MSYGSDTYGGAPYGAEGVIAPSVSFFISPTAGHAVATVAITATGVGTTWTGSNPFSISSGPGTISNYANISGTSATFDLAVSAVGGGPIVIADSNSSTSQNFNNAAVAPGAPTIGTLSDNHDGTISVTFSAPVDNGGASITSYTATTSSGGFNASGASSPLTISGINKGISQTVSVTATNSAGTGSASGSSNAVTPITVPGAPTGLIASAGNTQASITLTAPADNGGTSITGYTLVSSPAGGTDSNAGSTSLTHTVSGLTNGVSYTFTATATNSYGSSAASSASNAVTPTIAGSWEVPAGGSGSIGFTCTGLGSDGTYLLVGDFTNSRIVKTTFAGAYVSEILLASAPASSVQGVAFDSSDSTYWVCHYAVGGGSLRQYNASGALLTTYTVSSVAQNGPNGCWLDSANDRLLTAWDDGKIRGYDLADGSLDETITLSGISGTPDGICGDISSPSTILWVSIDALTSTAPSTIAKITRSTGAAVFTRVIPTAPESLWMTGANTVYMCADQGFHFSVANGNRVWKLDPTTGEEINGVSMLAGHASFALATSSGTQIVTGLGIAPKLAMVSGMFSSDGAVSGNVFGWCDSQMRQGAIADYGSDNDATADVFSALGNTVAYVNISAAGGNDGSGAIFSVTHDGFLVNVTSFGATRQVHVDAITGDDVEAFVGSFDLTTGTGTQAVSGLTHGSANLTPKLVLFANNLLDVTTGFITSEGRFGLGAMTSSAQWCFQNHSVSGGSANTQGVARTDAALVQINSSLSTTMLAAYSAFAAGSFTVNKSTGPAANTKINFAALGGNASYKLGAFTQPNATTGNLVISGVAFTPKLDMLFSAGRAASTTPTTGNRTMIGGAVSSSSRATHASTQAETGGSTDTAHADSTAAVLLGISDGGTPTRLAVADFVSQDADGFTINYSVCDAVLRQNLYVAFGDVITVPGAPTIGTATGGDTTASVAFTAPASNGGSSITGYTATSTPGSITASGPTSPIAVSGLTNGVSYTFTATATNSYGSSAESAASNSVTPNAGPATAITLSGPSSGHRNVASTNFTVGANGLISGSIVVTPTATGGGTFTPSTVTLTSGSPTGTFTFTPSVAGNLQVNCTNNSGMTAPSNVAYTSIGFTISPSVAATTGVKSITATGYGTTWSGSNPFSITSGPGTGLTNYSRLSNTSSTFDFTLSAVSGVPVVIADSNSTDSVNFRSGGYSAVNLIMFLRRARR